jgi:hypothetical protein
MTIDCANFLIVKEIRIMAKTRIYDCIKTVTDDGVDWQRSKNTSVASVADQSDCSGP